MAGVPGYRKHETRTRGGRKVIYTPKVKEQMADALCKAFDNSRKDTRTLGEEIINDVETGKEKEATKVKYEHYSELLQETFDIYDTMPEYITLARYSKLTTALNEDEDFYSEVKNKAEAYCYEPLETHESTDTSEVKEETGGSETELLAMEEEMKEKSEKLRKARERLSKPQRTAFPTDTEEDLPRSRDLSPTSSVSSFKTVKEDHRSTDRDFLASLVDAFETRSSIADMPRILPDIFDGDIIKFPKWWATFEIAVDQKPIPDKRKLVALLSYTSEEVRECIDCFITPEHDPEAYVNAKALLHSRYGNPMLIAEEYKKRLYNWPKLEDGDGPGLMKLSNFLWQCLAAMSSLSYLKSLDSAEENKRIVSKLPNSLITRWSRYVDRSVWRANPHAALNIPVMTGDYPTFSEFCSFIGTEARIATGPCASQKVRQQKAINFGTQAEPYRPRSNSAPVGDIRRPTCSYCKGSHMLHQCEKFLAQPRDVKRRYTMERGLCFGCFRRGHREFECTIRNERLMQDNATPNFTPSPTAAPFTPRNPPAQNYAASESQNRGQPSTTQPSSGRSAPAYANTFQSSSHPSNACTMILPVLVASDSNPDRRVLTYAAIDTQSDCSFIAEELADMLEAETSDVTLALTTMGSRTVSQCNKVHGLKIRGETGEQEFSIRRCYSRKEIPISTESIPDPRKLEEYPHLKEICRNLPDKRDNLRIGLLVGYDSPGAVVSQKSVAQEGCHFYGLQTGLGWTFIGHPENEDRVAHHCYRTAAKEVTHHDIVRAFDLDFQPSDKSEKKLSADDQKFLKIVSEGIVQREDKHFEIPLPMREEPDNLPAEQSMAYALKCLQSVGKRMKKNSEFGKHYVAFMQKLIESPEAEPVDLKNDSRDPKKTWYWSHHGVYHPAKPGKIRGVFNGSARICGIALNDLLLAGPDQINNLVGVLLRFRMKKTGVISDIENMFHQVFVTEYFRDFLRFFWFKDGDPDGEILCYRMKVHLFGATSSPGCANYALRETANRYEEVYGKEAADYIRENFYVDDGMGGADGGEAALNLVESSHALCAEGGFNLCKYASTDKQVIQGIPTELRAPALRNITLAASLIESDKALGVELSLERDSFILKLIMKEFKNTRRSLLSCLSAVFDPMGLASPILLKGRVILQRLCTEKMDWDASIPEDIMKEWTDWILEMEEVDKIEIKRKIIRTATGVLVKVEIHTFSDASICGYGCCCYSLVQDADGNTDVTLLYAKSRVNPVKTTTVPRLELQAAVLGVRCYNFVKEELRTEITAAYFYTDSSVVLGYILNLVKRFLPYVTNRASYIRELTQTTHWRYISTERNPADIASRGLPAAQLATSKLWWEGPEEMHRAAELPVGYHPVAEDDPELKKEQRCLRTKAVMEPWVLGYSRKHSSWSKLVGYVTALLTFPDKCRQIEEAITSTRRRAQELIIRAVQGFHLAAEVEFYMEKEVEIDEDGTIETCGKIRNKDSQISTLDPFIDSKLLLRVGGRLKRSCLNFELKHPVIIPQRSHVTTLIISHYHEEINHQGPSWTLGRIRQAGIWIVRGKQAVTAHLHKCVKCIRARSRPSHPRMSDLPEICYAELPPFTYTGTDVFGPFPVKIGRSTHKRWCCIFVCMASRAVHLEVLHALDTSAFLNAFRRFDGRRGPIRALYSDRGSNFIGGQSALKEGAAEMGLSGGDIGRALQEKGCEWLEVKFNVPKASNMGGTWERQIRTVRAALFQTLSQHGDRMCEEVLRTTVVEAEAIVNSRPTTYIQESDISEPVPLSPASLLTLKNGVVAPLPGKFESVDRYVRGRWRHVQYLAQMFWCRWRREILPEMQRRQKWKGEGVQLQVGDLVLLTDEGENRQRWPVARVTEVMPGADGRVRKITVKTKDNSYQRPVNKTVLMFRPGKTLEDEIADNGAANDG